MWTVPRRLERNDVFQSRLFCRPRWKSTPVRYNGRPCTRLDDADPWGFSIGWTLHQSRHMDPPTASLAVDWSGILKRCIMIPEFFFCLSPVFICYFSTNILEHGAPLWEKCSFVGLYWCKNIVFSRRLGKVYQHVSSEAFSYVSALCTDEVSNYQRKEILWRCENHAATPPFYI